MARAKTELAIVNRGFWPRAPLIGEALLCLAERVARTRAVSVITQSDMGLRSALDSAGRGMNVCVMASRSRSDSSSGLVRRTLDAVVFMGSVFVSLVRTDPERIYVSTNPPVVVPFVVFLYARMFDAKYCYHVQDIHPEAASVTVRVNPLIYKVLRWADGVVLRHAASVITLSDDMKHEIEKRSGTSAPIHLVDNPAPTIDSPSRSDRIQGVVFCGNAGRLQRMPLVIDSIRTYLKDGGVLAFTFVGGGVYAPGIKALAEEFQQVTYHGVLPAGRASEVVREHAWALMPIDDEVTRYAFPSKSSTYALSGCNVLAVCGQHTSVARWVEENGVGVTCAPEKQSLLSAFREIERRGIDTEIRTPGSLEKDLGMDAFVDRVVRILDLPASQRNP